VGLENLFQAPIEVEVLYDLALKAALGCLLALALPCSALAAPASFTGPASIGEGGTKATYTVNCGDQPNPLSPPAPLPPLPPIPNAGALTVAVAPGPTPAATEEADYGAPTTTTIPCPAAGPVTFDVPITGDTTDELNEAFTVTVSGALVPQGQFSQAVTTAILDDDVPVASVAGLVQILEGDAGASNAQLAVTLSQAAVEPATISYSTEPSSALAGSDFTATSGQLVIPAGAQAGTISIPVIGDTAVEKVEGFYVNLTAADKATINPTKGQGAVAIFDNDKAPLPVFSIVKGVTVKEGNNGTVNTLFAVTLSRAATQKVQVGWKTASFSANLADYAQGSGTLVFQPGQTAKNVSVVVKGDLRDEPNEAFSVLLEKPVGGQIGAAKSGFGIITDDDGPKVSIGKPKVSRKRALVSVVRCPQSADRCTGRLVATAGKLKVGSARFGIAKGASAKVKVKLSRKARRALRKRARRVKFTANAADASGARRIVQRTFRVKRLKR
jgi:hypothetical protein